LSLVIHATNIHQGGGRTLLVALLSALRQSAVVLLDKRLAPLPSIDPKVRVIQVAPSIVSRLQAEHDLKSLCESGDTLLCFGNLPPLFANRSNVFVYLQNRYLTSACPLSGLPWLTQLRIRVERIWLRNCLRNAKLLVQTETMAQEVRGYLGVECQVLPFFPPIVARNVADPTSDLRQDLPSGGLARYDYLYVATGEPHKNHKRLFDAWILLAKQNCFPSLCLTLHPQRDAKILAWIERHAHSYGLRISNHPLPPDQIGCLYAKCGALIYPSLFESFGLPLLEARASGMQILAPERDYVRDIVAPIESFDPNSALSIARAVLRHRNLAHIPPVPGDAASFLLKLEALS
jgi:glycosyltransferase involved in cell wall biosynthesis